MPDLHYLARFDDLVPLDGPYDAPEGVAKAAKLYARIFDDKGPWVMVVVRPMPDADPPINEDAADICAALIKNTREPECP